MPKLQYSKIALSQTIVALCKAKGIKHIVISPGSRNAPLTIGFTEDSYFECYSVVDERCAAFFAMGIAQQLQKPTAVVCTSGSALLNYYPAVAEAYYSATPLVVISADRPKEMIDIGDGQTIRQEYVLQNHVRFEANLLASKEENEADQLRNEELINEALNTAIVENGPVHINAPFYEPLYEKIAEPTVFPENEDPEFISTTLDPELQSKMLQQWNEASKKMILVGVNAPKSISQRWIDLLHTDPGVLLFTETTSNIQHASKIGCIDQLISPMFPAELSELQPDILITFGGMIVSKKVKTFLREYQPKIHWHIDPLHGPDTFFCLTEHIKMKVERFFDTFMIQTAHKESNYQSKWTTINAQRKLGHKRYLEKIPFTDLIAFDRILNAIPDYSMIQLGNSSTIRYSQLFQMNPTITVFCNRGTSGIEGSTSTAIGAATASDRLTTFITGDLSFFYDSNGLWNRYVPKTFKIIVINNNGGGIFRILPGKESTKNFEQFFETTHQLTAKHLCGMYDFEYNSVKNEFELEKALDVFYQKTEKPQLLEVFTPRELNDTILIDYFNNLG